ncbi:MAG: molecular chaperone TorD family protein [Euryarchaeota archaeon]|nr:molecular chaperone TorD family protein [Euryarchaeota archaeon]
MSPTDAEARMERYALLRWGFLAADRRSWAVIRSPEWREGLARINGADGPPAESGNIKTLSQAGEIFADAESFEGAYHATFGGRISCSPYETDYTSSHAFMQARELADISGFYRAFGYAPAPGGDRVDHVALELDFLYALGHREAVLQRAGDAEGAATCLDATRKFLESHTGRFLGRMEEVVGSSGANPFFVEITRLTRTVVEGDVHALGLHPAAPPAWSDMLAQGPDEHACGGCPATPGGH